MKHWQYLRYLLRHKWYVLVECWKLGIPWAGLTHDLSKFRPSEWYPYVNYFYASRSPQFSHAWLLHQRRNPHHWQYWMLQRDSGDMQLLPMPDRYRREMLADWRGAGKAQGRPNTRAWYRANAGNIKLHGETREWIEERLLCQDN